VLSNSACYSVSTVARGGRQKEIELRPLGSVCLSWICKYFLFV